MEFMYNICVSVCVKKEFFIFPLEIISLRCLFFRKALSLVCLCNEYCHMCNEYRHNEQTIDCENFGELKW